MKNKFSVLLDPLFGYILYLVIFYRVTFLKGGQYRKNQEFESQEFDGEFHSVDPDSLKITIDEILSGGGGEREEMDYTVAVPTANHARSQGQRLLAPCAIKRLRSRPPIEVCRKTRNAGRLLM